MDLIIVMTAILLHNDETDDVTALSASSKLSRIIHKTGWFSFVKCKPDSFSKIWLSLEIYLYKRFLVSSTHGFFKLNLEGECYVVYITPRGEIMDNSFVYGIYVCEC